MQRGWFLREGASLSAKRVVSPGGGGASFSAKRVVSPGLGRGRPLVQRGWFLRRGGGDVL